MCVPQSRLAHLQLIQNCSSMAAHKNMATTLLILASLSLTSSEICELISKCY